MVLRKCLFVNIIIVRMIEPLFPVSKGDEYEFI